VFSAGDDAMIRAWDVATATSLMSVHNDWVRCVAVAESRGHQPMVVSGSDDATVGLWDRETGTPHGTRLTGHRGAVRAVTTATLAGTPVAVSGGIDGTIRVWDLETEKPLPPVLRGHTDWVRSVAVATLPDKRQVIVACGDDGEITIWDLETRAELGAARTGHTRGVRAVAVSGSADEPIVVSGGADGNVRRAPLTLGGPGDALLGTHRRGVSSIAAVELPGRSAVVCGDEGGEVITWDVVTGEVLDSVSHRTGEVAAVATAAALRRRDVIGRPLLAVAAGATLTLSSWQPEHGWRALVTPALNSEILAATFAAGGRWVVLATKLGIVVIDFSHYRKG
jgi:WD40 repeat protein